MPKRTKRRAKKHALSRKYVLSLLALIIIAGIVIAGFHRHAPDSPGLFIASATPQPLSADEILLQYFSYIENGQFESMYHLLTGISQSQITLADFVERNRNIYEGIDAHNITATVHAIHDVPERPGRRIIDYTLRMDTIAGEMTHDTRVIFELNANNEYRLQWNSSMIFPQLGDSDRVRVSILPARRGNIFDRNGVMLAGPGTASAVGLIPGRMRREEISETDSRAEAASINEETYEAQITSPAPTAFIYNESDITRIAELLEMTPENVIRRLNASYVRDDIFVQLRIIAQDAQDLIDELLTIQGVMISTAHVRYYPLGSSAAHLVGYVQNINAEELEARRNDGYHMNSVIGRAGLESIFEDRLRARDGREIFIVDSQGNRTATLARQTPVDGRDLRLTIDAAMQRQIFDLFADDKSASVATNPLTGEVLALVSTPSYDPNDFVRGMTTSVWTSLTEDDNLPLFNRFRSTFSPGSTMKAITAAIGLDTDIFHPQEDFGRSGLRWQLDDSWGGFFVTTVRAYDEPANLNHAMAHSDNIYFAKAALRIGADLFTEGLQNLGFANPMPFEYGLIPSSISRTGNIISDIQLADSGYGQGEILMNPVHLAAIYAAFVNDGNIIEPWLIHDRPYAQLLWLPEAFSPQTARYVLDSLIFSVEYGTGRGARIPGMTLAGKTGTSEIKLTQDDTTGTELGWFVLLTADKDTEHPLLVLSMVEDVHGRGGSGYVVPRVTELFR